MRRVPSAARSPLRPRLVALLLATVLALWTLQAPASRAAADPALDEAEALFTTGALVAAAEAAERVGTAEGLAFATRMLANYGHFFAVEDEREAVFERAVALGEKAVAADPTIAATHIQLAHALGRYAQQFGVLEALAEGFAGEIRERIDAGLAIAPNDPVGNALLGGWHAEIVSSAGFFGGLVYGADSDEVFPHFETAIEASPDDPLIRFSYADAMLKLDDEDYLTEVRAQLEAALAMEPRHALDAIVIDQARALLESLNQE